MLTNGKGFYHPLVYVLECHRLGLKFLPPSVNEPGPAFVPHGNAIRVPLTRVKGLTERTTERDARRTRARAVHFAGRFLSAACCRAGEELEAMIRAGAFDEFGETRTRQFWEAQHLHQDLRRMRRSRAKAGCCRRPALEQLPAIPLQRADPPRTARMRKRNCSASPSAAIRWNCSTTWPGTPIAR